MTVQNHIHLSTTIGAAPENAPNLTWKTIQRLEMPRIFVSIDTGLLGDLVVYTLKKNGEEVQLEDHSYILKCSDDDDSTAFEKAALIKAMHGKFAYLVDHDHVVNGADHTPCIQRVFVQSVGALNDDYKQLYRFEIEVQLADASYSSYDTVVDNDGNTVVDNYGRTVVQS